MISDARGAMLSHSVYFTLKDNSDAAVAELIADCKKYLTEHPGTVFFSVGTRAEDFNRDVNDCDFDVALHLVFKDRAAHDVYQDTPRHGEFLARQQENWKAVRVFDVYA
jgi:hypothetical protein